MAAITTTTSCPEATISELGERSWPIWTSGVSLFPWTWDERDPCLLLEGEVSVIPEAGEAVTRKAGDLVVFAKGMLCEWVVTAPVRKHHRFGSERWVGGGNAIHPRDFKRRAPGCWAPSSGWLGLGPFPTQPASARRGSPAVLKPRGTWKSRL